MVTPWTLRRPFIVFLVALNIAFIGILLWLTPRALRFRTAPSQSLPALASARPFTLTRESGEAFSSEELRGGPWIASFIFTRCSGQCPMVSARVAALQKDLPATARLVSFSVDPAYDTPAILKDYAARFGARPERWIFLTGDPALLRQVQTDLKVWNGQEQEMHTLRLILMDENGDARGYYDSQDAAATARLRKDLRILAKK